VRLRAAGADFSATQIDVGLNANKRSGDLDSSAIQQREERAVRRLCPINNPFDIAEVELHRLRRFGRRGLHVACDIRRQNLHLEEIGCETLNSRQVFPFRCATYRSGVCICVSP